MAEMKSCPTCGVQLYGKLVDAIADPFKSEACPQDIKARAKKNKKTEEN